MATAKKEVTRYLTPPFVASFPRLFEAHKMEGDQGKPKYSVCAIWKPGDFNEADKVKWNAILKGLDKAARDAFKTAWKDLDASTHKKGLRNGKSKEGMAGFGEGTRFANLTSLQRPGVIDKNKAKVGPEEGNADEIYPGCICRATVTVYSYGLKKGSKGKGVAIGLTNLQKLADGPRLDNRVAAEDDFDEDVDSRFMDDTDIDGEDNGGDEAPEAEDDFD